jgi:hypothetical protein
MNTDNQREWILIAVILCTTARDAGNQYTKRLLPDFLLPYSPIRLDRIMDAERQRREEGASLEDCCQILGCVELRTVRKHFKRLYELAGAVGLQLSEQLAHNPQYACLPEVVPEQGVIQKMYKLHDLHEHAAVRAGHAAMPLRHFLQAHCWHYYRTTTITCVSRARPPP